MVAQNDAGETVEVEKCIRLHRQPGALFGV